MRVDEFVRYTKAFYPKWDSAYAERLLRQFGLNPAQRLCTLSKGQMAKAGLLFGACMVLYQTSLWTLARFRVIRVVALGLGGLGSVALASLPFLAKVLQTPWLTNGVDFS